MNRTLCIFVGLLGPTAGVVTSLQGSQATVKTSSTTKDYRISPILYFPDALSEVVGRAALHSRTGSLVKGIGQTEQASLLDRLEEIEQVQVALQRHEAYLRIQVLENKDDRAATDALSSVSTDISVLQSAVDTRLRHVPPDHIASLGRFAKLAAEAQRAAVHGLVPEAERYRNKVTYAVEQSIATAYDHDMESIRRVKGAEQLDFAQRRRAILERESLYNDAAPRMATLLSSLVEVENRDAVAAGYGDAAERKYAFLGLDDALVTGTLATVAAQAPAFRRYQQLQREHAANQLSIPEVLSTEVNLTASPEPTIPIETAVRIVLEGLQPLGPDYTGRFAQLLDPANGRIDLQGGAHRAGAGTSISAYDAPVALFYDGYNGTLKSVSTIAHEGGHAIHRELMNAGHLPVYERTGPHWLFEGYAIFNELLVLDHVATTGKSAVERERGLERFLAKISLELFTSAEEASFERNLYKSASGHPLLERSQIDDLYRSSIQPYEVWPLADVGTSRAWISKTLLFADPLYLVNYLYAALVAVTLFDRVQEDPHFANAYEALLRRGFDADPDILLASIGVQLNDPALLRRAIELFEAKTEELRRMYAADRSTG